MAGWGTRIVRAGLAAMPLAVLPACQALKYGSGGDCGEPVLGGRGAPAHCEPRVASDPSVMALATDLDHLEKHIDWYGSVVPKAPDVWGQARLTQYREEFEREMNKDLTKFSVKLNGSLSRTDQAYLAYSEALSLAAGAAKPGKPFTDVSNYSYSQTGSGPVKATLTNPTNPNDVATLSGADGTNPAFNLQRTLSGTTPGTPAPTAAAAGTPPGPVKFSESLTTTGVGFAGYQASGLAIEPAEELAQKKRYLDFLNQLRRENEGDDIADSPATRST